MEERKGTDRGTVLQWVRGAAWAGGGVVALLGFAALMRADGKEGAGSGDGEGEGAEGARGGAAWWTSEVPRDFADFRSIHVAPAIPAGMALAGEAVPMDAFGVRDQIDRELVVNAFHHSSTMLYLKRAARWFPVIEPILAEEGVPEDFKYLAVIESGLDQTVSPAGAAGFWQFMKGTAPQYGLEVTEGVDERYDVEKSTRAACRYLKDAYKRLGSWSLAAASYNMGMGGVSNALKNQGVSAYWDLHLNSETARYVYRLLAIKQVFEQPEAFGFVLTEADRYTPYATRVVKVSASVGDLALFARNNGSHLKALKTLNPWLRGSKLTVAPGRTYEIKLPA
jgi:hypothetical protein